MIDLVNLSFVENGKGLDQARPDKQLNTFSFL